VVRPAVTVLTPTLNAEQFLSPMLSSLREQTLDPSKIEHIVIDAGSKDGTVERIHRESPSTRIITAKSSIYEAMNIGLREAQGACIGWLNADDLWSPDALASVARTLEARPESALVIGDYEMFDGTRRFHYETHEDVLARIREGRMRRWFDVWVNPLAVFYRTDFLREMGGYDPSYRLVGDWDLWFRAAAKGASVHVAHTGSTLGSFRMHPGSLTSGTRMDRLFEEKRRAMARWISDERAPAGLRECARRMYRHDTLSLMAVRSRGASVPQWIAMMRELGRELRAAGDGLSGDFATASMMAAHELCQSLPGVGTLARAAWAATGGPRVSSNE
jgi:GT2 family glycosyltransferase